MNGVARAGNLYDQWIDGRLSVQKMTDDDLALTFPPSRILPIESTLGHALLFTATSHSLVVYLLKERNVDIQPVIRICMSPWIRHWWSVRQLCDIWKLKKDRNAFVEQLGPVSGHFFGETPLGVAIREFRQDVVRLFLQWGCQLPLNEELPAWAWAIDEEVREGRNRCRAAVIAFSIASRKAWPKQTGWHDLCPMVMKMIWKKRFKNDWI